MKRIYTTFAFDVKGTVHTVTFYDDTVEVRSQELQPRLATWMRSKIAPTVNRVGATNAEYFLTAALEFWAKADAINATPIG